MEETCEETLGRGRKRHKTFVSVDTLKKIEAKKKVEETLNRRWAIQTQAEEASGRGDAKELYYITRKLAGD